MSKLLKPVFVRQDSRGIFCEAINEGSWKSIIFGEMKKGAVMGNHYHKKTKLFFFIVNGEAEIDIINVKTKSKNFVKLGAKDGILLSPHSSHAIHFIKNSVFVMGKSKKYDSKNNDTYEYTANTF